MTTDPASHPSIYRRFFTPTECAWLQCAPPDDPSSEINLIRVLLMRILRSSSSAHSLGLETQAGVLSAFSQAGLTMAALVRLRNRLDRQQFDDAISRHPSPMLLEEPTEEPIDESDDEGIEELL